MIDFKAYSNEELKKAHNYHLNMRQFRKKTLWMAEMRDRHEDIHSAVKNEMQSRNLVTTIKFKK